MGGGWHEMGEHWGVTPRAPLTQAHLMNSQTRLCFPGCLSLSGPRRVTGIVGGSLSVECRYAEKYRDNSKYWCKAPCLLFWKIVETKASEREVMRGHVSIRDHPANLTFTVTLESLREDNAGTYECGITVPFSLDPTVHVVVSVFPGEPCTLLPPVPATGLPEECQVRIAKAEI